MNNEPKILLTIDLEGVLSQEKEPVMIRFEKHNEKGTVILKTGFVKHMSRKLMPCVHKMKISESQYAYFTDSQEKPDWFRRNHFKGRDWWQLSVKERLEAHLQRIAENHTFTYEIIE